MDAYLYDEDAGNAGICAIEAYCGDRKGVTAAASQLLAHAQSRAYKISTEMREDLMSASGRARVLQLRHLELDRLERAVSFLEREVFSVALLPQLRSLLAGEKSPALRL